MESRTSIPDRKLLVRLVLIREEARSMMGGGIMDERNDRGLKTLPEAEVCVSYPFSTEKSIFFPIPLLNDNVRFFCGEQKYERKHLLPRIKIKLYSWEAFLI